MIQLCNILYLVLACGLIQFSIQGTKPLNPNLPAVLQSPSPLGGLGGVKAGNFAQYGEPAEAGFASRKSFQIASFNGSGIYVIPTGGFQTDSQSWGLVKPRNTRNSVRSTYAGVGIGKTLRVGTGNASSRTNVNADEDF